jgi:hypothetical protein
VPRPQPPNSGVQPGGQLGQPGGFGGISGGGIGGFQGGGSGYGLAGGFGGYSGNLGRGGYGGYPGGMAGMQGGYGGRLGGMAGMQGGYGGRLGGMGGMQGGSGGPSGGQADNSTPEDRARQAYEDRYRSDRAHRRPTDTPGELNQFYSKYDRDLDRPFRLADNDLGLSGKVAGTVLDWKASGILDLEWGLLDAIAGETLSGHRIDPGDKALDAVGDFLKEKAVEQLVDGYVKEPLKEAAEVHGKWEGPADLILWIAEHAGTDAVKDANQADTRPNP